MPMRLGGLPILRYLPQATPPPTTTLGVRPIAPSDPSQLLAEISMVANADNHSELSGFDSDMMTTEEMNEILESRNRSLIEHTMLLHSDKLTKWTKEMNRQMFNKSQSQGLNPLLPQTNNLSIT